MKSTNIIIATTLIIAVFALISMPQMIVSANAQSVRASEHACSVPGYTLIKGECTPEPITEFECKPSSLYGVTAARTGTICTVQGTLSDIEQQQNECEEIGGRFEAILGKKPPAAICTFPATEIGITCPGGVPPTEEGECITKPGRGNDPT